MFRNWRHRKYNYICVENDPNKIYVSTNNLLLNSNSNDTIKEIEILAKNYASEYSYTYKHVSVYENEVMIVALYKNISLNETDLELPNIDFGECYYKVIEHYNITENYLITTFVQKENSNPSNFNLFFHPRTGIKLDAGKVCQNDIIKVEENLFAKLDENSENYDFQISLEKQGINIFDINDPYYKDICYDFDNPKNKDIALKDRILETYVDVQICEDDCINTGIDLSNNKATCDCKFNEILIMI